jgi:hypothetical protein
MFGYIRPSLILKICLLFVFIMISSDFQLLDLEYIMVPEGPNPETNRARAIAATNFPNPSRMKYFIPSGNQSSVDYISKILVERGANFSRVEGDSTSFDSLDNYLSTLEYFGSDVDEFGVATDKDHFRRFMLYEGKAREEGRVLEGHAILHVPTVYLGSSFEKSRRKIYGLAAYGKEILRLRKGLESATQNRSDGMLITFLKNVLWTPKNSGG